MGTNVTNVVNNKTIKPSCHGHRSSSNHGVRFGGSKLVAPLFGLFRSLFVLMSLDFFSFSPPGIRLVPEEADALLLLAEFVLAPIFCLHYSFKMIIFLCCCDIAIEKLLEGSAGKYATGDKVQLADVFLAPQIYVGVTRFQIDMVIGCI
ncbi:hypothetical protein BHE74_00035753 [Ensete ventricosum]|nr:hypothetical protein BHE74_00035753 [Ensete ventricosum]